MIKGCFDCIYNTINSKECDDCIKKYKDSSIISSQVSYDSWNKEKPNFEYNIGL